MKNIQKSVLALTLLIATATQPFSVSLSVPKMQAWSMPELTAKNGLLATGAIVAAAGLYKYRNEVGNALGSAVNAVKNGASAVTGIIMRNKVQTAIVVGSLALSYFIYDKYFSTKELKVDVITESNEAGTQSEIQMTLPSGNEISVQSVQSESSTISVKEAPATLEVSVKTPEVGTEIVATVVQSEVTPTNVPTTVEVQPVVVTVEPVVEVVPGK